MKRILLIVVLVFVALIVLKDQIIKATITSSVQKVLGARATIGQFSLSLMGQKVKMKNLKIYNPPGFPNEVLVDIPEVEVDYDLSALLKKELHLPFVVVNLKELVVIKNESGQLNVDQLKVVRQQVEGKTEKKEPSKPAEDINMKIDRLSLTVGKVIYKDYTQPNPPTISVFEANIDHKEFQNITSAQQLATLVLLHTMKSSRLKMN